MADQKEVSVVPVLKSSRIYPERLFIRIEYLLSGITFGISGTDLVTSGFSIDLFFSVDFRCLVFGSGNFCDTAASNKLFCLSMYLFVTCF